MIEAQLRAARALVGWSQGELAQKLGVPVATIKRMESGGAPVSDEIRKRAKETMEAAGVTFTNGGEPGVKLRAAGGIIPPDKLNASNDE